MKNKIIFCKILLKISLNNNPIKPPKKYKAEIIKIYIDISLFSI
jgi:hypothetical protein